MTSIRDHSFHLDSPGQSMSWKERVFLMFCTQCISYQYVQPTNEAYCEIDTYYLGCNVIQNSILSRPDLRELFMSLFRFGQGVISVGILCSFFYVLYFFVLAGYGSQSGRAVYRCL